MQTNPTDPEELMAQYDREHTPYVDHALKRRLSVIAGGRAVNTMMDFGCGSGHLLGLAKDVFGCRTFGVEVNPVARVGAQRFGFSLHEGPLELLVPPEGGFDLIYAGQVFEHLPEPRTEIGILAGMLSPGGAIFIEVPNYKSLSIVVGRDSFISNTPPGHLNYFTPTTLSRLAGDPGLFVESRRTSGLNHRALLGREQAAATELPLLTHGNRATGVGNSVSSKGRVKLRLLGILDSALSIPGWGMQAAVVARSSNR